MKKIISYIIHLFIMPCSQATLVMEQQQTQKLSLFRRLQLKAHLSLCKICAVYYKKLAFLEDVLTSEKKKKEKSIFQSDEIQNFKEELKQKMKK